jgi:NAD(P)-dependent dehydrogenase (short-subunit alcohol dehydrogenase family)
MNSKEPSNNKHKHVLITGCSSGFGLFSAVDAAQAGFTVTATMRNLNKKHLLQAAIEKHNLNIDIQQLDVTDPESIHSLVKQIKPVDILINNAGILITGSFLDQTDEEMRKIFETNYFGAVNLTRAVTPAMIEQKSGRIINIASLAGLVGHPFNAAYAASKHAIIGFSKSIRIELAPFGIHVVSIEPGYHRTEIIGANAYQSENFYDRSSPMFSLNRGFLRTMFDEILPRAGDPQAVADVILKAMTAEKPKNDYIIGKDARFAATLHWLGMGPWLSRKVMRIIKRNARLENQREADKKARRKQKHKNPADSG